MALRHLVVVTSSPYFSESMQTVLEEVSADIRLAPCDSEDEVISQASGAEAIITTNARFSKKVLESLPECRFIIRCGIGLDNFDIQAATERGILIANLPGWYHEDLTDHIMAFILSSSRKLKFIDRLLKSGEYSFEKIQPIRRLRNQVLGLIGFGKIPRFLLGKLKPFRFQILVYDPYLSSLPEGLEKVDLRLLLSESDIVSIHCPLTEETRGLIGERELSMMKPGAYVLNTARGAIIDEEALASALRQGRIAGAALDVLSQEPPPPDHPLLQLDNVTVTPHISWYSEESLEEARTKAAENVAGFFKGEPPSHPVNPEVLTVSRKS